MRSSLTFTYDSLRGNDGTGAQLQRIFGIYAFTKLLGVKYLHSGIENLMIHSLDPFQNEEELKKYLKKVNETFNLPSSEGIPKKFDEKYHINRINLAVFGKYYFRSFLFRKNILVGVLNPYPLVELYPKSYLHVQKIFANNLKQNATFGELKNIVIHIRRGSNGADLLPGELAPRMLPNRYYVTLMKEILSKYGMAGEKMNLLIITDAPKEDITYRPIESQVGLWLTEPRLEMGSISIKGESFSDFESDSISKIEVIHGGDPLDAIEQMRAADFLIMSRSSFSYIGAILNEQGTIMYPPAFGHKAMPKWYKVKNWIKVHQA